MTKKATTKIAAKKGAAKKAAAKRTAAKKTAKKPGPSDWHHKNKSETYEQKYKRKTKPYGWGNGPGK